MLKLYQSNQLEQLVDLLAAIVSQPQQSVFAVETVIVPHQGMRRWISLHLAERLGICANMNFILPAGFIWRTFRAALDEVPEHNQFEPAILTWRILDILDDVKHQSVFKPVLTYLAGDCDVKRYDLACRIAEAFDQYLLYRPDWIMAWEAGDSAVAGDAWQAELWRRLSMPNAEPHWINLQQQLHTALLSDAIANKLPERITLFGVNTLSPGYLETLNRLSKRIDIHLFLLNPCAAYWTEIIDEELKVKCEDKLDGSELYLEVGQPLLASLGRQGRDFFASLIEYDSTTLNLFEPSSMDNILGQLQRDIQYLHDRTAKQKQPLPVNDRSLQFHSCHSIMREVEVLKDQLLDIFQENCDIEPSDVLVMSPDIDAYAAYVEAVFSSGDTAVIPYQVVDKSITLESPLIAGFFSLLQIEKSRFDSNSILALLEITAIQRYFGLAENDLYLIARWVKESGIRWGWDGAEREQLGLPNTDQNSWCAGLDRMLLGYALPADGRQLFQGMLAYNEIEGTNAAVLGSLNGFVNALFNLRHKLQGEYTIEIWVKLLFEIVGFFLDPSEQEALQLQHLCNGIETLGKKSQSANFKGKVTIDLVQKHLKIQFSREAGIHRALSKGVTFCTLATMRSLPYKVICLIGMNDGAFPRRYPASGFDLMAKQHRFGDRIDRADDKYLFLEALISARHILYISYIGQHIRDNSTLPPSGLVDELLDYLEGCYHVKKGGDVRGYCIIHHNLQAFSKQYFQSDSRLFSYSKEMYSAYAANQKATAQNVNYLKHELSEPDLAWRQIKLAQLIKFFSNPTRYFLQNRLGIYFEKGEEQLEATEPFALEYFTQCEMNQSLVEKRVAGQSKDECYAQIKASGQLPHGCFGMRIFEQQERRSEKIVDKLQPYLAVIQNEPFEVDISLNEMQLFGHLNNLSEDGQFGYSIHAIWHNQLLALWIKHLVLNVVKPSNVKLISQWLDDKKLYCFSPVEMPEKHLGALLDCYWKGLRYPLNFFPKSSREYMEHRLKNRDVDYCLNKAKLKWSGEYIGGNEGCDPYYRLAFPAEDVFDDCFIALSEQIFKPLLEHLKITLSE